MRRTRLRWPASGPWCRRHTQNDSRSRKTKSARMEMPLICVVCRFMSRSRLGDATRKKNARGSGHLHVVKSEVFWHHRPWSGRRLGLCRYCWRWRHQGLVVEARVKRRTPRPKGSVARRGNEPRQNGGSCDRSCAQSACRILRRTTRSWKKVSPVLPPAPRLEGTHRLRRVSARVLLPLEPVTKVDSKSAVKPVLADGLARACLRQPASC